MLQRERLTDSAAFVMEILEEILLKITGTSINKGRI
jgi:hypothetical protein